MIRWAATIRQLFYEMCLRIYFQFTFNLFVKYHSTVTSTGKIRVRESNSVPLTKLTVNSLNNGYAATFSGSNCSNFLNYCASGSAMKVHKTFVLWNWNCWRAEGLINLPNSLSQNFVRFLTALIMYYFIVKVGRK